MANGLEGVVAAETVLSHADGERGIIWVRGQPIPDLVAKGFEATVALMWEGFAGEKLTRARGALADALRYFPAVVLVLVNSLQAVDHPLHQLRITVRAERGRRTVGSTRRRWSRIPWGARCRR